MKTLVIFFVALAVPYILSAQSSNNPAPETTSVEVSFGSAPDCFGRGRTCLSMAEVSFGISPEADALGELYYDKNGRLSLEIVQVMDGELFSELEAGNFIFESITEIPVELLPESPHKSPMGTVLNAGNYASEKLPNGHYLVKF